MSNHTDFNQKKLGITLDFLPMKSMGILKVALNLGRMVLTLGYEYLYLANRNVKLPWQAAVLST